MEKEIINEEEIQESTPTETKSENKIRQTLFNFASFVKTRKKDLRLLLIIVLLAGALLYIRGQLIVAVVNGQSISRFTLIRNLEKQAGKQVLDSLITKILIYQEAKKENVIISEEEINQEIAELEKSFTEQGQDLDLVLGAQGVNREELKEQFELQKIAEKIAGKDVEVTDQEVNKYLEENKDLLSEGTKPEDVREQLETQKLNTAVQSWVQSLRDKAEISYFLKL